MYLFYGKHKVLLPQDFKKENLSKFFIPLKQEQVVHKRILQNDFPRLYKEVKEIEKDAPFFIIDKYVQPLDMRVLRVPKRLTQKPYFVRDKQKWQFYPRLIDHPLYDVTLPFIANVFDNYNEALLALRCLYDICHVGYLSALDKIN